MRKYDSDGYWFDDMMSKECHDILHRQMRTFENHIKRGEIFEPCNPLGDTRGDHHYKAKLDRIRMVKDNLKLLDHEEVINFLSSYLFDIYNNIGTESINIELYTVLKKYHELSLNTGIVLNEFITNNKLRLVILQNNELLRDDLLLSRTHITNLGKEYISLIEELYDLNNQRKEN